MRGLIVIVLVMLGIIGCQQSVETLPTETPVPSAPTPAPATLTQTPNSTATETVTLSADDPNRWATATMRQATLLIRRTDTIATQRAWGTQTAAAPTRTVSPTETLNTGSFIPVAPIPLEGTEYTGELIATADGQLWLATDDEIAVWQNEEWQIYASFAAQNSMYAGMDDSGRVWAVALDMTWIGAWDGAQWMRYGSAEGWQALRGWQRDTGLVHSDRSGHLWIATTEDIRTFDGERWKVIAPEVMGFTELEISDDVWSQFTIAVQPDGSVFVGHCTYGGPGPLGGHGVRWMDQYGWHGSDAAVSEGCVQNISGDDKGRILVGLENDVWHYDPTDGGWQEFAFQAPADHPTDRRGHVVDITAGPDGRIWVLILFCGGASCDGPLVLYRLDNDGQWHWLTETTEWYARQEVVSAHDTAWVFFDDIYSIRWDQLELEANIQGWSPVVDDTGQLWFMGRWQGEVWFWAASG